VAAKPNSTVIRRGEGGKMLKLFPCFIGLGDQPFLFLHYVMILRIEWLVDVKNC
jgi:hypothetical protein